MVPPRTVPAFEPPHRSISEPNAVAAYRAGAPEGEVFTYPLDPLDYLGVPVWSAELHSARGTAHYGSAMARANRGPKSALSASFPRRSSPETR